MTFPPVRRCVSRIRSTVVTRTCGKSTGQTSTALGPLQPSAVLVWPVDLPHVRVTTVERILETHRRTGGKVIVPTFADRRGHPVAWRSALFAELLDSPAATREGARAVLHKHAKDVVSVTV